VTQIRKRDEKKECREAGEGVIRLLYLNVRRKKKGTYLQERKRRR